jgi:hypothetical protein
MNNLAITEPTVIVLFDIQPAYNGPLSIEEESEAIEDAINEAYEK